MKRHEISALSSSRGKLTHARLLAPLQAKQQYFKDLEGKQKGLLAREVNGSQKRVEDFKHQAEHFKRRAEDAQKTIEAARSAMTRKDKDHARAVHVLGQGLCSRCKVHNSKVHAMLGRTDCKCDGLWTPEGYDWDDQQWSDRRGNVAGYDSYTYQESLIDSALDVYWVRVLAERIKSKLKKHQQDSAKQGSSRARSMKVLDLPESWPHTVPRELLGVYSVPCSVPLVFCPSSLVACPLPHLPDLLSAIYLAPHMVWRAHCRYVRAPPCLTGLAAYRFSLYPGFAVLCDACADPTDFIGGRTAAQLYNTTGEELVHAKSSTDGGNGGACAPSLPCLALRPRTVAAIR
jgi:hypothetical protein